jgi:arginine/lysine/ornithine decarboxylase
MAYTYEIYSRINRYKGKDKNRLHMPGHKATGQFKSYFPVAPIDFTELSFSDDLNCPTGAIWRAQEDLAQILGAKKAYITTDGSSSGVMAMVYVASKFGNKLIVPRSSHKSVFNACRIMGVEPVIVQGDEYEGVLLYPQSEEIEKLIVNDVNIAGMLITSPDYYGNIAPLDEYAAILKKYDRLLLCDGAHGAHLALNEERADYCGVYADMWVDGAHKTLPTLTQGAIVLVENTKLIQYAEEALSIFRTTSPSYPIMASVEYGVKYFLNNPKLLARAKEDVAKFKEDMSAFAFYPSRDWTKIALDCKPLDISADIVASQLEKRGIYPEMNDGRYILFYLSPAIEGWQLAELKGAIIWIAGQKKYKNTYVERKSLPATDRTYSFLYALKQKWEWVDLKQSVGKMCAENAGISPPCLPVVIAGEIISQQAVDLLSTSKKTFGIDGGKIKVVKK